MNTLMLTMLGGASEKSLKMSLLIALAVAAAVTGLEASAFTAPTAGTLGYDIYNVVVTEMLSGPIGFVGAVVLIVWGASQVMKQWLITVLCVIAGTVIIKCQTIVTSLGALVPTHAHHIQHMAMVGHVVGLH